MKITAVGAHRSMYRHIIADAEITAVHVNGDNVVFNSLTTLDPGIGTGQYVLNFSLRQSEVFSLYEQAILLKQNRKIEALEDEIAALKARLGEAG